VGAFLRRLFPEESGVAEPMERSRSISIPISLGSEPAPGPTADAAPTELGAPELPTPPTDVLSRPVHAAPETGRRLLRLAMAALGAALLVAAAALGLPRLSRPGPVAGEAPGAGPSAASAGVGEGSAPAPATSPSAPTPVVATSVPPTSLAVETDAALQRDVLE